MIRTALLLLTFVVTFVVLTWVAGQLGNVGPVELLLILVIAISVPILGARLHGRRTAT
jgi:hypothetical protein